MVNLTGKQDVKAICPRCAGNGYIRLHDGQETNCPQCNCVIEHKCTDDRRGKDKARRGFLKKKICRKCLAINQKGKLLKPLPEGVFINENGQVCSVCANCSKINVSKSSSISISAIL